MEENSVSRQGVDLPPRQINDFFYKKETEKNELVARPVADAFGPTSGS